MNKFLRLIIGLLSFLWLISSPAWADFPVTTVLDTFNRTNEGPPPGTGWEIMYNGNKVINNVCKNELTNDDAIDIYNASSYGPDSGVFFTMTTAPVAEAEANAKCGLRLSYTPGVSLVSGYLIRAGGTSQNEITIRRVTDDVETVLATITQAFSNGDSIGLSAIGNNLTAWFKSGAGAWNPIGSYDITSDTPKYTGSGYLYIDLANGATGNTTAIDNFGGGTIASAPIQKFQVITINQN